MAKIRCQVRLNLLLYIIITSAINVYCITLHNDIKILLSWCVTTSIISIYTDIYNALSKYKQYNSIMFYLIFLVQKYNFEYQQGQAEIDYNKGS
jgi:hypothetical protein